MRSGVVIGGTAMQKVCMKLLNSNIGAEFSESRMNVIVVSKSNYCLQLHVCQKGTIFSMYSILEFFF